jgi:Uma2 family endonuclease
MGTVIDLTPVLQLSREQFYELCKANPEAKLERSATGELIVMSPTGGETGYFNFVLAGQLYLWNQNTKLGIAFDSSTGFALPNNADRSPDVAWIKLERWQQLTPKERRGFIPLCPDFVIELLSYSDAWQSTAKKMVEYQSNGCRLGWLIDPYDRKVGIYRLGQPVEILSAPDRLSGEDVLPGFVLDLRFLWEQQ